VDLEPEDCTRDDQYESWLRIISTAKLTSRSSSYDNSSVSNSKSMPTVDSLQMFVVLSSGEISLSVKDGKRQPSAPGAD
jgi:hypothetical protein